MFAVGKTMSGGTRSKNMATRVTVNYVVLLSDRKQNNYGCRHPESVTPVNKFLDSKIRMKLIFTPFL